MSTSPPESSAIRIARSAGDIRRWIVAELSRSLEVDPATIDSAGPLDSLGVDSLMAIGMTGVLAAWLDRDLPATLMWDYPSVDAIAAGLADPGAREARPLPPGVIALQPQGDRTPVFFFPGRGGHPITFAALAAHLGPKQPCYGLMVPGLNGEEKPLTSVEEIATAMLKNIRHVQPAGPYQLVGYSFGGLVAYETAQQLGAAGGIVSMLAIYDTFTPAARIARPRWQRLALHAYFLATGTGRLQYLRERFKRMSARRKEETADGAEVCVSAPTAIPKLVASANALAAANYQPRPYPGAMLLFRATERAMHNIFYKMDASGGWGALAGGGVQIIDLPGTHLNILDTDHSPTAAERLRPYLSDKPAQ